MIKVDDLKSVFDDNVRASEISVQTLIETVFLLIFVAGEHITYQ